MHAYIWYFKLHICLKNRGFREVLKRIKWLHANKDGHSCIRAAFKELHSEKKNSNDSAQKFIQDFIRFAFFPA